MNWFTRTSAAAACLASAIFVHGSTDTNSSAALRTAAAGRAVIKIKAQLDAVAESTEMEAIRLAPRAWSDLTVIEAVPHGARVKKRDVLVRLDLEKLRDQIDDLEQDKPISSVAFDLAQSELENLRQTTPNKLETWRRAQRIAEDDYKYFQTNGRASREKNAKFNVKASEQRLQNANEEMKQLEKMYKADDITEETEEIVLKRQRFVVESAQFYLQNSREGSERELSTMIPREEETLRNAKRDSEAALALAEQTVPKTLAKKQLDFDKMKRDMRKAERRLTDLRYDLDALTPRATMDGVVYYGACDNGKWTSGALVAKKLVPGSKLMPNEVLMTVVNPDKLRLRATISESELANYSLGLKGDAAPVSAADRKLAVKLDEISTVPQPGGGFDAALSLTLDKSVRLVPGMNCKVSFANIQKPVSVAVPKQSVFSDTTQKYVYVRKSDGSNEKRVVKTGESDESLTEITDGLADGDKVLLKKPEA